MIWRPEDGPVAVTGARGPVPERWRTGRAARLAGAGLVVVLACLATFVLWSLAATSQLEQRVELTSTVADGYQQVRTGAATEAAMEREYRLEPGPQSRAYFAAAADQLQAGLDQVQRRGNAQDRMAVAQLTAAHEGYRLAVAGMFAAVDRGDAPAAVRLAVRDVAPWAVALRDQVWDVAESHRAESQRDLTAMRHLQRLSGQLTPVVFLGGLIMLILFTMVLRGYRGTLQRQQAQALHDARHDALTGLPNRSLLVDRCDQALRQGRRQGTVSGLLLLDLDRFKEVNDALGQACGDALLVQVGTRLTECIREMDTVARLGADEYAVLMPAVGSLPAALSAASRLRQAIESPFRLGDVDVDVVVEVSVGVAVSDSSMTDAATLLQQADSAMYAAKQQHLGVAPYSVDDESSSPQRLAMLGELRRGMSRGELVLHYQPKVSLSTGEVSGVEALVRWQHPERGLLPPDDFIPLAERTGLIGPLTDYVLDAAFAQARLWIDVGRPMTIAVNVSGRNLLDEHLLDQVRAALDQHGVPASRLVLEVTETAIIAEPRRTLDLLTRLSGLGVRLSIDDFGAGYTSLAQLSTLPVTELKIDRSFVSAMTEHRSQAMIVHSLIELGHNLGLTMVAEGVETAAVMAALRAYGCDVAQGYYLTRPLPIGAFDDWCATWSGLDSLGDRRLDRRLSDHAATVVQQRRGTPGSLPRPLAG